MQTESLAGDVLEPRRLGTIGRVFGGPRIIPVISQLQGVQAMSSEADWQPSWRVSWSSSSAHHSMHPPSRDVM